MSKIRKILAVMMMAALVMTAGCDKENIDNELNGNTSNVENKSTINPKLDNDEKEKQQDEKLPPELPQKSKDKKEQAKEMKIKVYYPDESGLRLVAVNREVEVGDKYEAAVKAVMTPPIEKNLTKVVNNDKSLISVKVNDGEAIVNLNSNIKVGFSGGSTGEEFLIGSIVNTLTEFSEVKTVQFLIDGKKVETLSGHMDLSEPIKRMDNLLKNN